MSAPVQLVPQTQPPSGAPNPAFTVPGPGRTPWGPVPYRPVGLGYAEPLDSVPGGTPDPMRLETMPQRDDYPDPREPPGVFYYGAHGIAVDYLSRTRVETEVAKPWVVPAPLAGNVQRFAPDPRWTVKPEYRLTERLSPSSWSFTRPYDQKYARRFNGSHFSMADHRRTYPIYGMAPAGTWRNIVQTVPPPWDQNLSIKAPSGQQYTPNPQIPVYNVPIPDRGWVLT